MKLLTSVAGLLVLLLHPVCADSQEWTNYLNSNYVNHIVPADDLVWCATTGGLAVYDQRDASFAKLTNADGLLDNDLLRLAEDHVGNRWFLCRSGVSVMSADGGRWAGLTDYHGIPGERLLSVAVSEDTTWLGTDEGGWFWDTRGDPFQWTGGFGTFTLRNNVILTILQDGQYVWFGTEGGVCRALKESPGDTSYQAWYTTAHGLPSNEVRCLVYSDTTLWAGTAGGAAWLEDGLWVTQNQGLPSLDIRALAADGETVWAATAGGVASFGGTEWEVLNDSLPTTNVRCVAVDSEGTVWVGTAWEGIAELVVGDSLWRPHLSEGPAGNNFSAIALGADGSLWCTHYRDPRAQRMVSRWREGEWQIYNSENEWGIGWSWGGPRWVTLDSRGSKWFGVFGGDRGGVIELESDDTTWHWYQTPVSEVIGAVAVDREDNKWFSAYNAAVLMLSSDDSTWTIHSTEYTRNIITIAVDSSNNKYFGSWLGEGLTMLTAGGQWRRIEGLPSNLVVSLEVDREGNLWVGTVGGVCKVMDGQVAEVFTVANTQGRLLGDPANDICADWAGGVWFEIESRGVNRLNPDGSWRAYTPGEGLVSDEIYDRVDGLVFDNRAGFLWIATRYGLSRFETEIYPAPPHVDSIEVYPNPFVRSRPDHHRVAFYRVPAEGAVRIYTPSGRLIKEITEIDPVTHRAFWDGTNESGQEVASGMYIFVVTAEGRRSVGKIALIR